MGSAFSDRGQTKRTIYLGEEEQGELSRKREGRSQKEGMYDP